MSERLPTLKPSKVIGALKRAGFFVDHVRGSHYYFKHDERPGMLVVVPYHRKDLKRGTLRSIIDQSGLTRNKFLELL